MQKRFYASMISAFFAIAGLGASNALAAGEAAPAIDPPRWHSEDTTPQARYQTAKKEAGAAYQEALNDCRSLLGAEKTACVKEAQATFAADMAEAKKLLERS